VRTSKLEKSGVAARQVVLLSREICFPRPNWVEKQFVFPSPHVMSSRPENVYPPILPDAQIIALEIVVNEPYITAWRCWIVWELLTRLNESIEHCDTRSQNHMTCYIISTTPRDTFQVWPGRIVWFCSGFCCHRHPHPLPAGRAHRPILHLILF
jgi:hypothetical protein